MHCDYLFQSYVFGRFVSPQKPDVTWQLIFLVATVEEESLAFHYKGLTGVLVSDSKTSQTLWPFLSNCSITESHLPGSFLQRWKISSRE